MNKGFTLIELLVVVIILGVLGAIVVGNLGFSGFSSHKERYVEKCVATGDTVTQCKFLFYRDYGY